MTVIVCSAYDFEWVVSQGVNVVFFAGFSLRLVHVTFRDEVPETFFSGSVSEGLKVGGDRIFVIVGDDDKVSVSPAWRRLEKLVVAVCECVLVTTRLC